MNPKRLLGIAMIVFAAAVTLIGFGIGPDGSSLKTQSAAAEGMGTLLDFALIGDTRYTTEQQQKFLNLITDMNKYDLAFIVHDGDIKAGSNACSDNIYTETRDLFNQFAAPLIYSPGDNEWTDCHRAGGNSLERLDFVRKVFFPNNMSMGQKKMALEQQERYPENARWTYGGVTFATLHIVGSNNNIGRTPEHDNEYVQRNIANLNWMTQTFDIAKANGSIGVMLIMQANMWDNTPPSELIGFGDTLRQMERDVLDFGRPVVLVNGDSHYYRVDKPLMGSKSMRRIENFTRVETFGTDDVHWLRVTIDPKDPQVFMFRQQIVEANRVKH